MIYMIFSQIIILLLNLALLVMSKITDEFHELIYIIPIVVYSISMIFFYLSYIKTMKQLPYQNTFLTVAIFGIIINIALSFVEIFVENPDNPILLYICVSVVQLINLLVLFHYMKSFIMQVMAPSQQLIHKILSYVFVILAVLALYCCFINIFIVILLLIASAFFATISTSMFLIASRTRRSQ